MMSIAVLSIAGLVALGLAIALSRELSQYREGYGLPKYAAVFVAGALFPTLTKLVVKKLLFSGSTNESPAKDGEDSKIYSLKHGVLNISTLYVEMWMNMGYWKGQSEPKDFPLACRSLLHEILLTAKILSRDVDRVTDLTLSDGPNQAKLNIVDVGFGCGDQLVELLKLGGLAAYTGITIDRKQFVYASHRRERLLVGVSGRASHDQKDTLKVRLFNADAANPLSWQPDLRDVVVRSCSPTHSAEHKTNWILALDVMYHFSPSRLPLFGYAHQDLQASIMAFDLLLPDSGTRSLTMLERLLLRLVALASSTPFSNFLTPSEYRSQLMAAGYNDEDVEIRDISAHVFRPLVEYMTWQDRQLQMFGLGIGAFHAARWIFGWWARSGVVRGCIVIARYRHGGD